MSEGMEVFLSPSYTSSWHVKGQTFRSYACIAYRQLIYKDTIKEQ